MRFKSIATFLIAISFLAVLTVAVAYILFRVSELWLAPWAFDLKTNELLQRQSEVRTNLVQLLTALAQIIGGAALIVGLFFTWRNLRVAEDNLRTTNENTLRNQLIIQEGQLTDRFIRAIAQLGDDKSTATRLGGIYALERIARDSEKDHLPVMEVLTAFVRENVTWKRGEQEEPQFKAETQAILTVIGRRLNVSEREAEQRIDLHHTDLRGLNLTKANLSRAILIECNFEAAFLASANLEDAYMTNTYLGEADISSTNLAGADLTGAIGLTQEQVNSAIVNAKTKLPPGLIRPHSSTT